MRHISNVGHICDVMNQIEKLEAKIEHDEILLSYIEDNKKNKRPYNNGKRLNLYRGIPRMRLRLALFQLDLRDSLGIHYDLFTHSYRKQAELNRLRYEATPLMPRTHSG